MSASPERVAARHMNRARAKEIMDLLDTAGPRWARDWWLVLEELASGGKPHADEYNYAFHALKGDIGKHHGLPSEVTAALTELRDIFAARTP